jgi:RNA polymerase sigma-70 factor (ECF subfamily)
MECAVSDSMFREYLLSAKSGSSSGLGRMLESFRPALMEMAADRLGLRVRRRMSSSDLVQDTLLTAGKQFESFRGESLTEFRNWLKELFHSRLVDGLRRHQQAEMRRQGLEEEDASISSLKAEEESPSRVARLNEDATRLINAMDELPADQRTIIQMRYVEDKTFEDIAAALSMPVATVWRRFQEATESLHIRLQH